MQSLNQSIQSLTSYRSRYQALRSIFKSFQNAIEKAGEDQFPVKDISVTTANDTTSHVKFLDRDYVVVFAATKVQGGHKGRISMHRVYEDGARDKQAIGGGVTFNGQGTFDIQVPAGADAMSANDEGSCLSLLLGWLVEENAA